MTHPSSASGHARALFIATAPSVVLAVAVLGPSALFGLAVGMWGSPVMAATGGLGLAGLAGLVRLWIATWGSRDAPAWAALASAAGILLGIRLIANVLAGGSPSAGDDAMPSWLLPTAVVVAQLGALILLASRWTPRLREAWRRPVPAAMATLMILSMTGAVLARGPALLHAIALRSAVARADEVTTFHHDPFVVALCGGHLDEARALLDTRQVRAEAQYGLVECLEHGADGSHPVRTFYPDRVAPLLDGLVAAQRAAGIASPEGCTPGLVRVIRVLASEHPDALREFGPRHLPLDCIDHSSQQPAWWTLVATIDGRPLADRLRELQAIGIDTRQRTAAGVDLLGANVNDVIASLTDDDLADVIAMGLDPDTTSLRTRPFSVELAERRFDMRGSKHGPALDELIKRHGEPTVPQLLLAIDLGRENLLGASPGWDEYLRHRLKGVGTQRIAGTTLDSAHLRFHLRRLACAGDATCEAALGNPSAPPPPAAAPRDEMSPKPSVLAELARRDYRFRVIRIENAARASAAIAALNQHSSFDDVLCRYGLPPSQAEGISGAPWTAGSTLPAARLAALGALAPGEYTRTPIWEAGRFLVLRLEATRAAVR